MLTPETQIIFTPAALAHIQKMRAEQGGAAMLHFGVKKTGCSGYSYVMNFIERAQMDDRVFVQLDGLSVCVDKESWPFVKGTTVDYKRQGLNTAFEYQNPNESSACGCGESFTISE